jgi:DNA-binding NarL/FixJ family response regulator/signal transduction histidine kinase
VGKGFGLVMSVLSVLVWIGGDVAAGAHYSRPFVPIWNAMILMVVYFSVVWLLTSLRRLHNELESKVKQRTLALTQEMAERARLEKELVEVSEREQRRFGHDLHDSLCQHLTGTALAGQVLAEKLAAKGLPESADAHEVVELVEDGITLARNLARGIYPVEVEAEGLMAALGELAATIGKVSKIACVFECDPPVLIEDAAVGTQLYRIAQEAISNAIRHGKAKRLGISLSDRGGVITLTVEDDGTGLPEGWQKGQGLGTRIMAHRAGMIGCEVAIEPNPTGGTMIRCWSQRGPRLPTERSPLAMSTATDKNREACFADDHPLVREWLTNLINQQPDLSVCGESENAPQALQAIGASKPDIAIVDLSLKDSSGIELIKALKEAQPGVAVLVLSMHDETHYAERALRAGAKGYVMKRETTRKVIEAIRRILEGKLYISEKVAEALTGRLAEGPRPDGRSPVEQLSDRELEVFEMLGQGQGTRQISEALRVSVKTVQAYCARIKEKMNLSSATELLREAIRWSEKKQPR